MTTETEQILKDLAAIKVQIRQELRGMYKAGTSEALVEVADWLEDSDFSEAAEHIRKFVNAPGNPGDGSGTMLKSNRPDPEIVDRHFQIGGLPK